jgi:adenine-specific DNA methylase
MSSSPRLIERWLPIAELGEESVRERRSMTALPPVYYLHVWWARRPLVASRAAILASLLPADADQKQFMRALGIHGDPIASRRKIDQAKRSGTRFEGDAYSYDRAFKYTPSESEQAWLREQIGVDLRSIVALDPTAGGGSVPMEALRVGLTTFSNDLNPVAVLIQRATFEWPAKHGMDLVHAFNQLAAEFVKRREERLKPYFPAEPEKDCISTNFLWSRTVKCPYCEGLVPLSPNWRLAPDGAGVRLKPRCSSVPAERVCEFEIVTKVSDHSGATVAGGDASCPFPDCVRVIEGDEIKRQAQAGQMSEQLYTVVYKRRVVTGHTKAGKEKVKWVRGYRSPVASDENSAQIAEALIEKMPGWEALNCIPNETIDELSNYDRGHRMYGMVRWVDLYNPRQLISHATASEVFIELWRSENADLIPPARLAAFAYLAIALDKGLNYNSRASVWMSIREVVANTFNKHGFAICWSYAEMPPLVRGVGYDWAIEQTAKCIQELVELIRPADADTIPASPQGEFGLALDSELPLVPAKLWTPPPITITNKSGDALDHLADCSVDVVVMDPPYYDNVMYAELSDFFYVWLKRTAGLVFPELFRRKLTDKENEAVANPAKFRDQKGGKALAGRDYQERMSRIFDECRRVLKPEGIMTLMFTHKATGAWDALTQGLMKAGFVITASWPINTEAEGSMHIKDKAAANSTIFLACRPRAAVAADAQTRYWEDVEPLVAAAVRGRVEEFQRGGIRGVDLYLACFGPALEEFSRHWPLKRGTPKPEPKAKRRAQKELFPEARDPYEVTPEDALNAARREVKSWRLEQLTHKKAQAELDPRTSWFVLAWDAFQAPVFPYDEALRLARAVGVDLDADIVGHLAEKKGSDLVLWDSAQRAAKHALGAPDGSQGMIDALHHAANQVRTRTLDAGRELLEKAGVVSDSGFAPALLAVLEVLPISRAFGAPDVLDACEGAASDFEALEKLRRLAFSERVDAPRQLELWAAEQKA